MLIRSQRLRPALGSMPGASKQGALLVGGEGVGLAQQGVGAALTAHAAGGPPEQALAVCRPAVQRPAHQAIDGQQRPDARAGVPYIAPALKAQQRGQTCWYHAFSAPSLPHGFKMIMVTTYATGARAGAKVCKGLDPEGFAQKAAFHWAAKITPRNTVIIALFTPHGLAGEDWPRCTAGRAAAPTGAYRWLPAGALSPGSPQGLPGVPHGGHHRGILLHAGGQQRQDEGSRVIATPLRVAVHVLASQLWVRAQTHASHSLTRLEGSRDRLWAAASGSYPVLLLALRAGCTDVRVLPNHHSWTQGVWVPPAGTAGVWSHPENWPGSCCCVSQHLC